MFAVNMDVRNRTQRLSTQSRVEGLVATVVGQGTLPSWKPPVWTLLVIQHSQNIIGQLTSQSVTSLRSSWWLGDTRLPVSGRPLCLELFCGTVGSRRLWEEKVSVHLAWTTRIKLKTCSRPKICGST